MARAFENVRIIDFAQVLAGPWAATQLALLGADVIKIEQPGNGDMMRRLTTEGEWAERDLAPAFLGANPNKRAITLDLKHPAPARCSRVWSPTPTWCWRISARA